MAQSSLRLSFHGASGEVTGSMYLLEAAGSRVLLDAGLFQGRRAEARAKNASLPIDPRRVDSVVVTHAHIDHTGRLPLLVREGFHGPVYATPATRDLMAVMLPDAAAIQESDAQWLERHGRKGPEAEPLYTVRDAMEVQDLVVGVPYRRPLNLRRHLAVEFHDAGHILGSASVDLRITEGTPHRIVFSGDIGRWGQPIIRDPQPPVGPIDTLVVESTYAQRAHGALDTALDTLADVVTRVAKRGGKVLIPAFALGRTQELVYALHQLHREGRIPAIPVYVDSPLAVDVTSVFRMHAECFDRRERFLEERDDVLRFPLLHYVREVAESKALNQRTGPAVIIAASGMCESGRIVHHLRHEAGDYRNLVLFVGFQAEHTLGRRLQEGARVVKLMGEELEVHAEVAAIDGLSAHADQGELRRWVRALGGPIRRAFCVHGEPDALRAMADLLRAEGVGEAHVPALGETVTL